MSEEEAAITAQSRQRAHDGGKFSSERQRRYLWSQCPKAARKWAHNLKTRPSDWRGCRIQTRPGIGMVSDGSIGGTMAKLVIEIDPEKIPELMEQLLGNGMVETMEVADVEDDEAVTAGPTGKSVSDSDWNGSTSAFSDEQYKMAAAVCVEDDTPKSNCHLPHHNPDGSLNRKGLSAAAAFLDRTDIPAQKKASAAAHLRSHYQKDLEEDPPEAVSAAITAAISEYAPPTEFFGDPQFEAPQRWTTVTSDGRVMGHLALWGECHIGYPNQCITPEMITDGGFDYANGIGHVVSADGEQVGTSPLPIKGGHAPLEWDWKRAKAHYDDPSSVVADVIYGSDEHGIWFSGALRPDATDDKVYAIRASGISGDWRNIDGKLRLLAGCCVNNGGFPKMSARMNLAASGELQSAIAIGGDPEADPTLEEDCGCHETVTADVEVPRLDAIEAQLAKIEGYIRPQIIASLREKLAANE